MKSDGDSLKNPVRSRTGPQVYPFAAIVGQEEMKLGLLLNAIDPVIGGVLIMGHRGTGKSTAVRALADLLPQIWRARNCPFGCDPEDLENLCNECAASMKRGEKLRRERGRVPVVDLPLGATEDRVCGSINIESALTEGRKAFEPGLLARAHRGFLYIDEVNLLEDHLVDLLLDVAVTGRNCVERESMSVEHPARFVLVGSGNPEEGELRPQLLDRFGLHVEIKTIENLDERLLIVEHRDLFERDAESFRARWETEQENLRRRLGRARKNILKVKMERDLLRRVAELCLRLKIDGHRGELTIARAARALAAFEGRRAVTEGDVTRVAVMSLRHRLRRDPLEQTPGGTRIEKALEELFETKSDDGPANGRSNDFDPEDFQGGRSNGADDGADGNNQHKEAPEQAAPVEPGAELPDHNSDGPQSNINRQSFKQDASSRLQSNSSKANYNTHRGRYTRASNRQTRGAKIALDATLRAMMETGTRFTLAPDVLRYKLYKRRSGALFIFAIDASGSMALNRIRQAKGALAHLLERSYVRRDHVALVSFRGEGAEILLPPSRSATRARRLLDELPVGGATPLSSGLYAALQVALRAARNGDARRIFLFLFTDGRANKPMNAHAPFDKALRGQVISRELEQLGRALQAAQVSTVVVDTQSGYTSNGEGRALAAALNGQYIALPIRGIDSSVHSFIESMNR